MEVLIFVICFALLCIALLMLKTQKTASILLIQKKPSIAIYTVILGNYDSKPFLNAFKVSVPCYFVTDSDDKAPPGWIKISAPKVDDRLERIIMQRRLKTEPNSFSFLQDVMDFEFSLYVDGNVRIDYQLLMQFFHHELDVICICNPLFDTVEQEFQNLEKMAKGLYKKQDARWLEAFKKPVLKYEFSPQRKKLWCSSETLQKAKNRANLNLALSETSVLIRKNATTKEFNELWYRSLAETGCHRDQTAFDTILASSGLSYHKIYNYKKIVKKRQHAI